MVKQVVRKSSESLKLSHGRSTLGANIRTCEFWPHSFLDLPSVVLRCSKVVARIRSLRYAYIKAKVESGMTSSLWSRVFHSQSHLVQSLVVWEYRIFSLT